MTEGGPAPTEDADDAAADAAVTLTHTPSGGGYGAVSISSVTVSVTDNDTAGATVTPTALTVTEGSTGTYTVALATQPTAAVTVAVGGTSGDVTVDPSSLTFSTSNWGTPQTVTVSLAQDDDAVDDDAVTLTHTPSGGGYGSVSIASVTVTPVDDDTKDMTPPTLSSVEVKGNTLTIMFTKDLDADSEPASDAFYVTIDGIRVNVIDVGIDAYRARLTLASVVVEGQTGTLRYDKPTSGGKLQDLDGNEVESFEVAQFEPILTPPTSPLPVLRKPQPLQLALWTDRPAYRAGEIIRLYRTVDPHDDHGRYVTSVYLERVGGRERRYLSPLFATDKLHSEPVDYRGIPVHVAPARTLAAADRKLSFEGGAPEPGLWQFVMELRPGAADEQVEEFEEPLRTRRAWAKFAVAERSELLNVRGFDREVRDELTLRADTVYYLQHQLFVQDGATLTIEPGTVVAAWGRQAAIIVEPGGRILADGTGEAPVVLTCAEPVGQRRPGCWGGLRILGRAPVTRLQGTAPGVLPNERAVYGGTDAEDSSGMLSYVRVEFAGAGADPGTAASAIGLYGAGSGTVLNHVQAHASAGDGFAFSGGTAACDHCVASGSSGAGLSWERGWRGGASHLYVQHSQGGGDGIFGGHDPEGHDREPRSRPALSNVTLVHAHPYGRRERRAVALRLSDGSGVKVHDLVATHFGGGALQAIGRSRLLFGERQTSVRGALLWLNGGPQVPAPLADAVEFSALNPELRDVRDFANPDPRPKSSLAIVMYMLKVDAHRRAGYVGAFGWKQNWLEEWTVFGPESVYDVRNTQDSP